VQDREFCGLRASDFGNLQGARSGDRARVRAVLFRDCDFAARLYADRLGISSDV